MCINGRPSVGSWICRNRPWVFSPPAGWGSRDSITDFPASSSPLLLFFFSSSTASSRDQWALPGLNRERQISVGTAGHQPRAPDFSGHCWTSTVSSRAGPQPNARECQIECQNGCQIERQKECQRECQNKCQKVCQNRCQIECQIECQSLCQKECQIECQNKYAHMYLYIYIYIYIVYIMLYTSKRYVRN